MRENEIDGERDGARGLGLEGEGRGCEGEGGREREKRRTAPSTRSS